MEGFEDPLHRGTYPWGHEDRDLLAWFSRLGALRNGYPVLQTGALRWLCTAGPLLAFAREDGQVRLVTAVNASDSPCSLELLWTADSAHDLLSGSSLAPDAGRLVLELPPWGCLLLS